MRLGTCSALAALPLVLTLALTGCGSDDDGDGGVATVNQGKQAGSAAPSLKPDEMAVKFTQCLREHGLKVDDPKPGKGPMLKFDSKSGVDEATVNKAMEACRQYDPQQNGSGPVDPKAAENGRKYAMCMRKNGVEAFPDPKPGQRGMRITGEVGEDPDFQKAQQACQSILAGGGAGQ